MGIIRNAFTVGGFTLLSRIVGFVRECFMAFCLGASPCSDALLVAVRVPNTFRRIFAEGAFNASFLPRFSKVYHSDGIERADEILSEVFSLLLLILIPFSLVIIAIFPSFLRLLVSGFDTLSEKFALTVSLGRICFPYLIFISVSSLLGGVLNTINRFAAASAAYSLLSVFTICGLLIGYFLNFPNTITVHCVAWSVFFSGMAQSSLLFLSASRHGFHLKFKLHCLTKTVKDIMRNMGPGLIGAGVWQLNLLIDTTISSFLPTGTITCINLADRLNQFPLGTLGIAMSTALLPQLAKSVGQHEYNQAVFQLERGLLVSFFMTFFATALLLALSEQMVSVAFQRGRFEDEQVMITASAVRGFAIGLPAYMLTKVFSALYFAAGNTKSPVIFGIISMILNVVFLLLLVPILKYFGLALCTSLSAISQATLLVLRNKIPIHFTRGFWQKIAAQATAAVITYLFLQKMAEMVWKKSPWIQTHEWLGFASFFVSAAGVFFFICVAYLAVCGQQWKLWKKEVW
ncbi:MAG: murein biosynthesis integral membrane protein MurJ [Holosporaceae bacterium]|jgi:putative peptidoglycan lipid II flippase|nr:murein biosynthesis integral membrane protein MurJ [Holosporaceae bacterium]